MGFVGSLVTAALPARATKRQRLLKWVAVSARSQGVFACSEIGKGLAVVAVGDMIVAEEIGELVIVLALTAGNLLGHAQAATTHRYAHLGAASLRRATRVTIAATKGGKRGQLPPQEKRGVS
jgi:hypothetical protein